MPLDQINQGLTDDEIRAKAPSVFATQAGAGVSDKYAFIPTYPIIRSMRTAGLYVSSVREGLKKAPDGRAYAMHEVRMRKLDDRTAERTRHLGELTPTLNLLNSHDRTSGFRFFAGIDRFVCLNGMTVSDFVAGNMAVRHVGAFAKQHVLETAQQIVSGFGDVIERAERWSQIKLTGMQQIEFALKAVEIRGTALKFDVDQLLGARRHFDNGDDLWRTFNRVQENLTKGGAHGRGTTGRRGSLRAITSLAADTDMNRKLWAAAEEFATLAA